ncbi:alanine dehydrogenase [Solemya pervernicosa gill symbiont]|uniref:alanine dehydrogenase n=2 Tax=Gammaproteobacteria incertae sedis TaxID=118884 RepID=A0A1T2L2C7_9GAMM|nr:alanine dehydrogenase [Candidatus Reidiella endopervernicosa]OOZ39106.1 alanine dehydrogenase [Solemya pervernicosa gill symbiont]QKQ26734.1 alanine dehydrogenase [Candidatus Reidiella endopervernicosa]
MRIGVPREIKAKEGRVGLIPAACADLVGRGHTLYIEQKAGQLSGYSDDDYQRVGVNVVPDAATLYGEAELIVKVKEPIDGDLDHLRADHQLFCYLHLAAAPQLTERLLKIGLTAVAFETVEEQNGYLPLLAPMSDIAGKLSIQIGANLLQQPQGGKGLLMGGLPAAERGRVVVIGGGTAGGNAAAMAAAMGAEVTVFDRKRTKLERMRALGNNVTGLYPYPESVRDAVASADLLVGAALVTGARAPHIVSAEMVRQMSAGSVIVDISVDQGGCVETTQPTTYEAPTFLWEEVLHFGVTNMPGAVPRSASQALSASLIPFVQQIAEQGWRENEVLRRGINVADGALVHPALID